MFGVNYEYGVSYELEFFVYISTLFIWLFLISLFYIWLLIFDYFKAPLYSNIIDFF